MFAACGTNTATQSDNGTAISAAYATSPAGGDHDDDHGQERLDVHHVLLISVDGLHGVDAARWTAANPGSTLAKLARSGVEYTDAHTTTPSDSFPGMVALVTGGTPKTTGVYYDDSYDRTMFPPGSNCQGNPGTECTYFEILAQDFTQLFSPLNPAKLPMHKTANGTCKPVFPHEFVKVNTLFEVIHEAGGYTAWSDKHQAYDVLNGPSGKGIDDLYSPEVNSLIVNGGVTNGVHVADSLKLWSQRFTHKSGHIRASRSVIKIEEDDMNPMESTLHHPTLSPTALSISRSKGMVIGFWTVTVFFCLQIGFTAYAQLRLSQVAEMFSHLGFPAYFRVELSWAKLLGVVLLLVPVPARLKEWAYGGFAITLASALIAHISVGDGLKVWGWAAATGVLWGLSYFFWRRLQAPVPLESKWQ